jgi:hypothetical protein
MSQRNFVCMPRALFLSLSFSLSLFLSFFVSLKFGERIDIGRLNEILELLNLLLKIID